MKKEDEPLFHMIKLIPNNFPFTLEDLEEIYGQTNKADTREDTNRANAA